MTSSLKHRMNFGRILSQKSVSRWRKGQKSSAVTLVEIQSDPIELKIQIMEPTSLEKEKKRKMSKSVFQALTVRLLCKMKPRL